MPRTRPPYPEEFRREAVELVRSSGRPVNEIAKDLGVSGQSLHNWVKRAEIDVGRAPGLRRRSARSCENSGVRTGFSAKSGKS